MGYRSVLSTRDTPARSHRRKVEARTIVSDLLAGNHVEALDPKTIDQAKTAIHRLRMGQFWGGFHFANGRLAEAPPNPVGEVTALLRAVTSVLARCPRVGCRKVFLRNGRRVFCTKQCADRVRSYRRRSPEPQLPAGWRQCAHPRCGRAFEVTTAARRYCSETCGGRHRAFRQRQRARATP